MEIPKHFTLGTLRYTVKLKPTLPRGIWGRAWVNAGHIEISTHDRGKRRPTTGVKGTGTTFWHEVTHAILYDMGNPLYKDEAFVSAFSAKLGQIVDTAEM